MSFKTEIIRLLKEGKSVEEVVSLLNCSKSYVYKWAKDLGLTTNRYKGKLSPEQRVDVRRMLAGGVKKSAIAHQFGISIPAVYRYLPHG